MMRLASRRKVGVMISVKAVEYQNVNEEAIVTVLVVCKNPIFQPKYPNSRYARQSWSAAVFSVSASKGAGHHSWKWVRQWLSRASNPGTQMSKFRCGEVPGR